MANLASIFLLTLTHRIKRGGVIINEHTLSREHTAFHVEVLARWFDFIRLDELPQRLAQPQEKPFCLLTFDDGKRSHFTQTAPELRRLGVPAVFYVTTDPVTTGSWHWFDRRSQLVQTLGHCPAGLELETLKQLPFTRLMERLDRACAEHRFEPEQDSDDLRPMTWEQARRLHAWGFKVGAHGKTHAILTREPWRRAFAEIGESMAKVTMELGVPCDTFAFPNGNCTVALAQYAQRCGATTVMTTEPMWVDERAILWRLPRIQLFEGFARARIESKIALSAFSGALANPDGTGRRYRASHRQSEAPSHGAAVSSLFD